MKFFKQWLAVLWQQHDHDHILQSYHATFSTFHGQQVLHHLLDTIYCSVYEGSDPILCAAHNARRSVIHDILMNIDRAQNPSKFEVKTDIKEALEGEYAGLVR